MPANALLEYADRTGGGLYAYNQPIARSMYELSLTVRVRLFI